MGSEQQDLLNQLRLRHYTMYVLDAPEKGHGTNEGYHKCSGGDQNNGNAILVRPHLLPSGRDPQVHYYWWPHATPNDFRRVLVGETVVIGGHNLRVYDVHLTAHDTHDASEQANPANQAAFVARAGNAWATSQDRYVLLGGDFNLRAQSTHAFDPVRGKGFAYTGPSCGYTYITRSICIDMFWHYASALTSLSSRIVDEMNRDDSDHFPVKVHVGYQ